MNTEIRDHVNYFKAALDNTGITSDVGMPQVTSAACGARVARLSSQVIAHVSDTPLLYDFERFDSDGFHDLTTNTSRLTIPADKAGYYIVGAHTGWQGNATGQRRTRLRLNGTTWIATVMLDSITTADMLVSVNTFWKFVVGDYVESVVYQASGGNLSVQATAPDYSDFYIHRIAAS